MRPTGTSVRIVGYTALGSAILNVQSNNQMNAIFYRNSKSGNIQRIFVSHHAIVRFGERCTHLDQNMDDTSLIERMRYSFADTEKVKRPKYRVNDGVRYFRNEHDKVVFVVKGARIVTVLSDKMKVLSIAEERQLYHETKVLRM